MKSILACYNIGAIAVPLNPAYKLAQVVGALNHVSAKCLIISLDARLAYDRSESNTPLLQELAKDDVVPGLDHIIVVDNAGGRTDEIVPTENFTPWDDLIAGDNTLQETHVGPGDVALIQFTSGTTTAPKGACLTHRNIVNSALIMGERLRYTHRDVICCPLPLFHVSGTILGMAISLCFGATLVFPAEAFSPEATVLALRTLEASSLYAVPTMFITMLDYVREHKIKNEDFQSLRTGIISGSPVHAALLRRIQDVFSLPELVVAWGMSETTGAATMSHPTEDSVLQRTSTAGRPLAHTHVRVVARDDPFRELPAGDRGELVVSGYLLMQGYWADVAKTNDIMVRDPSTGVIWLRTGDEGQQDVNGYVTVTGRIKDVIIRGGENIHPAEIESLLIEHPLVQDASVIGIPDPFYGEVVGAFVVLASDAEQASHKAIRLWLATKLGRTWLPKEVFFVTDLPKTPSGKIQKFELREKATQLLADKAKWSYAADAYSEGIQKASSRVAAHLIEMVNRSQPITEISRVVDVGAGTGAATAVLAETTAAGRIVATDIAPLMLDKIVLSSTSLTSKRVEKRVVDVFALSKVFPRHIFTHTVSNMLLHILDDPLLAVKEMAAVTRSGGALALAITGTPVFPYILWERACRTLDDTFRVSDPFPSRWSKPRDLQQAFDAVGAENVVIQEISVEWPFRDGSEFVKLFGNGKHPGFTAAVAEWKGCRDSALQALVKVFDEEADFCLKAVIGVGRLP